MPVITASVLFVDGENGLFELVAFIALANFMAFIAVFLMGNSER